MQWILSRFPFEALVWSVGLVLLMFIDPHESHFSVCPISWAGFDTCPGCGLGRSISFLVRGDLHRSFETHPLGLFALIVLLFRIFSLLKTSYNYGKNN